MIDWTNTLDGCIWEEDLREYSLEHSTPPGPGEPIPAWNRGKEAEFPGELGGWTKGKPKPDSFKKKISDIQTGKRRGPLKGRTEYHPKYLAYLKRKGKFQD